MKRTKKSQSEELKNIQSVEDRANYVLGRMKHKDLQIACISRGMPFENILKFDHHGLASFFLRNFEMPEDPKLVTNYDLWNEQQLRDRGYKKGDAMLAPSLRLGYTGDLDKALPGNLTDPVGGKKVVKPEVNIVKTKRQKDEKTGVVAGTKKSLTYALTMEDRSLDDVMEQVIKKFPDAQPKSIKIWYKRAQKAWKEQKEASNVKKKNK